MKLPCQTDFGVVDWSFPVSLDCPSREGSCTIAQDAHKQR